MTTREDSCGDDPSEPLGSPVEFIGCHCGVVIPRQEAREDGSVVCSGCGRQFQSPTRVVSESEASSHLIRTCEQLESVHPRKATLDQLRLMLSNEIQVDEALDEALSRLGSVQLEKTPIHVLIDVLPLASEVRASLKGRKHSRRDSSRDLRWLDQVFGRALQDWDKLGHGGS